MKKPGESGEIMKKAKKQVARDKDKEKDKENDEGG
jgi:hypothetical protein